ncbi:MAG TPA: PadR family transcriptional regulator [Polyangiaceae bacterium]|nr:PadR family transcriptional regulator [Polyangiaceae bacterium]
MPRRPSPEADLSLNATAASILGFIEKEPQTGWELAARIEDVIGDFWNVTRSQIYRELKSLEAQGLVTSLETGPRDRQPYRITEGGKRAFRRWIAEEPGPPTMRIPLVLQVFFSDVVPREDVERSLDRLRAYHARRLQTYEGFEKEVDKTSGSYQALRLGLSFQRAMIDWIDSLRRPRKKRRT